MTRNTFDSASHSYKIDGMDVPSNTGILKDMGLIDASWYSEDGAERGRQVHLACQLHDEGDLGDIDVSIEPYLEAYKRFLAESGFVPELIEVMMVNRTHGYGTTIDRFGKFPDGNNALIEIKSGAVEPWVRLQLALQQECLSPLLRRFALQLRSDGTYRLEKFTDPNDRNIALAAVAVWWWRKNNLKNKGEQHEREKQ